MLLWRRLATAPQPLPITNPPLPADCLSNLPAQCQNLSGLTAEPGDVPVHTRALALRGHYARAGLCCSAVNARLRASFVCHSQCNKATVLQNEGCHHVMGLTFRKSTAAARLSFLLTMALPCSTPSTSTRPLTETPSVFLFSVAEQQAGGLSSSTTSGCCMS